MNPDKLVHLRERAQTTLHHWLRTLEDAKSREQDIVVANSREQITWLRGYLAALVAVSECYEEATALAAKPVESPPVESPPVQSPDTYLHCGRCGKQVSTAIPADTIVRAWLECPECLAAEPVQSPPCPE